MTYLNKFIYKRFLLHLLLLRCNKTETEHTKIYFNEEIYFCIFIDFNDIHGPIPDTQLTD